MPFPSALLPYQKNPIPHLGNSLRAALSFREMDSVPQFHPAKIKWQIIDQPPINLLLWEGAYDSSPKTLNTPLHLLLPTMGPPFGGEVDLLNPVGFCSVQDFSPFHILSSRHLLSIHR